MYTLYFHCVKSFQIWNYFWSVFSCIRTEYEPEMTPYLETFHSVFPIATLSYLLIGFAYMTKQLMEHANGRVVLALEGG